MLLRQGKWFHCKKTGHMAKDCPSEQGESLKKKADPARFAYTTIKALTKKQRESFTKMVMEDKDGEDFWNREPVRHRFLLPYLLNMYK
jgi:Zinc knuckle